MMRSLGAMDAALDAALLVLHPRCQKLESRQTIQCSLCQRASRFAKALCRWSFWGIQCSLCQRAAATKCGLLRTTRSTTSATKWDSMGFNGIQCSLCQRAARFVWGAVPDSQLEKCWL